MKSMSLILSLFVLAPVFSSAQGPEAPKILKASDRGVGRMIPDLAFTTLDGRPRKLSDFKTSSLTVIAFTSGSCPVAKKYVPTLDQMEKEFSDKKVIFLRVNPFSEEEPKKNLDEAALPKFIHDKKKSLATSLGAGSTTEVYLLDAKRTLLYRGALDDQYGLGYSTEAPKRNFLKDAILAALAGKEPPIRATSAPGCLLELTKNGMPEKASLTYHERISRIIHDNCQSCHRTGGVAPFPLETLEQVAGEAGMIKKMVGENRMPPWFAAAATNAEKTAHTPWANDRSLNAEDKADLLEWLAKQKTPGPTSASLIPRTQTGEWEIGTPESIFQIPEPIAVKASGVMSYQHVFVKTTFKETRWVRAWEVIPTAREVVHHVLIFAIPKEAADDENLRKRSARGESGGFFAAFVPGHHTLTYADGFAKELTPGAVLYFQIHYTPNGNATSDQTRLGLIFSKDTPKFKVQVAGVANTQISIPPGATNHPESAELKVPYDARILGLVPHMHVRGKAFRYEAVLADGTRETLLDVPNYDFNWQLEYRYADPRLLTAGSKLVATAWYDNSADNPANPDPTKTVKWGSQTFDEMMIGYVEYYLPSPDAKGKSLPNAGGPTAESLVKTFDADKDGRISKSELEENPKGKRYLKYFEIFDRNGDGQLDTKEIETALSRR